MPIKPGCYLYGLVRTTQDLELGNIGLENEGQPARVYTLRVDDVGAVVSDIPARQKILPLRRNLDPHHKVIREVMKTATILPMTFGHVARNAEEITRALKRNKEGIQAQLDRVQGKVEMGLKVKWDVDNIFEYFIGNNPELRSFRDQIFGRSSAPSQAEKIELGRMFEERLNRERDEQTQRATEMFQSCCSDVKVSAPKNETMVMDLAFLVERDALKSFEDKVYQVAGTFPAQYIFDYSGPWAPFNFVDLDLRTTATA